MKGINRNYILVAVSYKMGYQNYIICQKYAMQLNEKYQFLAGKNNYSNTLPPLLPPKKNQFKCKYLT